MPVTTRVGLTHQTGSTSGADVVGLTPFLRELRKLDDGAWAKELTRIHRDIAKRAVEASRAEASSMGGVQAKAATALRPAADRKAARVQVSARSKRNAMANVAFWGAKRRSGWYARERYAASRRRQHPEWVGNSWDVAVRGQGPYAINEAIADNVDQFLAAYAEMIDDLARRAFPD